MEKAEKLNTWDGWVFYNDKYYETIEDLMEYLTSSGEEIPEYVYICKTVPFP